MESSLYVGLSGQMSLEQRMETIARNIANMNTAGYRADGVTFSELISDRNKDPVAFVSSGKDYISRQAGPVSQTANPFDVAVQGDGWLAMATPSGTVYTRDGRMRPNARGELQGVNGYPMLSDSGQPISIDPNGGAPQISADGMITQDGNRLGRIGLFRIDDTAKLSRYDNSAVIPDRPATPITDFVKDGMMQGYVEGANINPIAEMTKLIMVSRAFEAAANSTDKTNNSLDQAIQTLGATS